MSEPTPTVALVHGAFADSSSWNGVLSHLQAKGLTTVCISNPLRSLTSDAAYVRDVVASIGGPVLLVGHSYGGMVITEAAAGDPAVVGLVYVAAFAPDSNESAFELSLKFPGSTLGEAVAAYPLSTGMTELAIRPDRFQAQFAADVATDITKLMCATQRPATQEALSEPLPTSSPAWKAVPSWFVIAEADQNIPAELQRFCAQRAAAKGTNERLGASHAVAVSQPDQVATTILDAVAAL